MFTGSNFDDVLIGSNASETFNGGAGNDILTGNEGQDVLNGGTGADTLSGGAGSDVLIGGANSDTFVFENASSSAPEGGIDLVSDFSQLEGDIIDLSGMSGLNFIGTDGFSGTAGELRFEFSSDQTFVLADRDGDGLADFEVHLTGNIALTTGDFLV